MTMTYKGMMGLGKLGSNNVTFSGRFRWMATLLSEDEKTTHLEKTFVKVSPRPNLDKLEEQKLDEITITILDVENDEKTKPLYDWLGETYRLREKDEKYEPEPAKLIIDLYDGVGSLLESWILKNVQAKSINFGELDFSSSDESILELTFTYTEAEYKNKWNIPKIGIDS